MRTKKAFLRLLIVAISLSVSACNAINPLDPFFLRFNYQELPDLPHLTHAVASSPDGTRLAYVQPDGLFIARIGGRSEKINSATGGATGVRWSGDGQYLVYPADRAKTSGVPGVELYHLSDGQTKFIPMEITTLLDASPDGRYLLGARDRTLILHDLTTGTSESIPWDGRPPIVWSPDSSAIAAIGYGEAPPIVIMSIEDRGVTTIENTGLSDQTWTVGSSCYPEVQMLYWGADSQSVHGVAGRAPQLMVIRSFSRDGNSIGESEIDLSRAIPSEVKVQCFRPSPDGTSIVGLALWQSGYIPGGNSSLIAIKPETKEVREVGPGATFKTWLGNTSRLVVSNNRRAGGYNRYFVIDVD